MELWGTVFMDAGYRDGGLRTHTALWQASGP